jgi:hypothetical protein
MVSLAIEEVIPPDIERLATGTVSAGAGVDGEAKIPAKHELEVGGMEALVLTAAQHTKESFTCVSVHTSEGEKIQKPLYHISGKFLSFILKFPTLCWIFRPQF